MTLFKLEDHEPIPSEEFYMIEEFKALFTLAYNKGYDGDSQGRARKRGHQEARFLYFYADYRSEFAKYNTVERINESLTAAGLDPDYVISDELRLAIGRYEKLRDSRNLRLIKSAWKAVDKLQAWFDDVDFTKPEYDPKEVMSNIANIGKLIKGLETLQENVMAEEGQEAGSKGGAEKGRLD
jgi:hypothetical protein